MNKVHRAGFAATAICLILNLASTAQEITPPSPPAAKESAVAPPAAPAGPEEAGAVFSVPPVPPVPSGSDGDDIIIRQKGKKDAKITVELHGGDVRVNGKPISEFSDKNISISRVPSGMATNRNPDQDISPFREQAMNEAMNQEQLDRLRSDLDRQRRNVEVDVQRALREQHKAMADQDRHFRKTMSNDAYLGVASRKSEADGALVVDISSSSPAEKAGLKKGDVITRVNGKDVHSPEDLFQAVHELKPGEKIKVAFRRDGKEQTVSSVLEKSRGDAPHAYQYNFRIPEIRIPDQSFGGDSREDQPKLGLKAQDAEDGKGVSVMDIVPGSVAEKAGLKKGDVILTFDGEAVNDAEELVEKVNDARNKGKVPVTILREGKNQNLDLRIPRRLRTAEL